MKSSRTNSMLVWVAILIGVANSVLILVILSHISDKSASLDAQIDDLIKSQKEIRSEMELIRSNLERLYSEIAGLALLQGGPESWSGIRQAPASESSAPYPASLPASDYDSYVVFEGECVAEGKGLVGLFINLYSKCPDVIPGYEINIQRQ